MAKGGDIESLEGLLDALDGAGEGDGPVSVDDIDDALGQRSFGPVLLTAGLIGLTPLGGVPGVPTALALIVALTSIQLFLGREGFWLPGFIRERSIKRERFDKAIGFLRKGARWVDRVLRARLTWLVDPPMTRVIALVCVLIALTMPPLEVIPFANTATTAALSVFGLGLLARDGLVIGIGFAICAGSIVAGIVLAL